MDGKDPMTLPKLNLKANTHPGWVPFAGSKRKVAMAGFDDNFDVDCRPAPAKQFAVDAEVANDILKGGYYYDPSIPHSFNKPSVPSENEEMDDSCENNSFVFKKGPGDRNDECGDMKLQTLEEIELCDSGSNSMHESRTVSEALSMTGVSLVLSDEIQETLALKKLNDDFMIPKPLKAIRTAQQDSMALVLWKPSLTGNLVLQTKTKSPRMTLTATSSEGEGSLPHEEFSLRPTNTAEHQMCVSKKPALQLVHSPLDFQLQEADEEMDIL